MADTKISELPAKGSAMELTDLFPLAQDPSGTPITKSASGQNILDMTAADNLASLANAGTARTNLGVEIGSDVQAYNSALTGTTGTFLTADQTKLDGIETSATADQTDAEIRAAVEAATDSNVFTDADHSKLDGIEASADVTDTTNVVAALTAGTGITIAGDGTIAAGPLAVTTVQTAVSQAAHLALTAQEGDVVIRSDENKSYMHNGGTAGTMADYTLLATPTDAVLSVNGVTGAVTAAHIATAVEAASDSNTFTDADHTKLNAIAASANNYVHPNHSGEVTSTADGATVIADNVVDEANLKISNAPTNGYVLTAQSANAGGLTWAEAAAGGYASSTSAPSSPVNGDKWFESTNGILYIYIDSNWVDISTATAGGNATHTGEVTGNAALTIADNVVDEANLKVSNAPTDGYFLSAQSGNTGGLTWAAAAGGGGGGSYDFISTITASGQSSFEWTSLSGYDTYYLLATNLKSNNDDTSEISGYIYVSGDGTNYSSESGKQAGFGRTQSGNAYWSMTNNRTPQGNVITQHIATIYNSSDTTTGVSIMARTLYRTAAQVQNNTTDMTFITSAFHETESAGFVSGIQKLKFNFYTGVVSSGAFSLYGVTRA
jgi:hypothetical protein